MNFYLALVFKVLYCFFESVWRRSFGDSGFDLPIYKYRISQHLLNIGVTFPFMYYVREFSLYESIYITIIIQIFYYTLHFNCAFDMGRNMNIDDKKKKEYKTLFEPFVRWVVPEKEIYGFGYDFVWMTIRFSYPLLLIAPFFGLKVVILGFLVAYVYGLGWVMQEKGVLKKLGGTEWAEWVFGFLTGAFLAFC